MLDKVNHPRRLGSDIHEYLIALLKAVQLGWAPPGEISREEYYSIKAHPDLYPDHLVGFVGFLCSFGGKWFGGYAQNKKGDNYADRGRRMLLKQKGYILGTVFKNTTYDKLEIPPNSVVYCDPPYEGTTGYRDKFDHSKFWQWCRGKAEEGLDIYISEYSAPEDFTCLLEVDHRTTLSKSSNSATRTEKLFTYYPVLQ